MSASAPMTPQQIFRTLDAISRTRPLSEVESLALERAMAALDRGQTPRSSPRRPWLEHELAAVRRAAVPRGRGRPRLGEDHIVPMLAEALDRTPEAIRQQMKLIRGEDRDQLDLGLG